MTVTFLPTGRHLVSGGEDGVVACYRIPQAGMTSPGHVMQENDDMGMFITDKILALFEEKGIVF